MELGWARREFPFEETSERRALYRVADPFLNFWYGIVRSLSSALSFSNPQTVYEVRIAPRLADYMGRYAFEDICHQWLARCGTAALGATITEAGRWRSRDAQTELDVAARFDTGGYLFGECKWSANRPVGTEVYGQLLAKIARLPDPNWQRDARRILFSVGGFAPELEAFALKPENRLSLVGPDDLLSIKR